MGLYVGGVTLFANSLILIADDNQDTRELYGEFLSQAGFRVALARDGAEAVDKARELNPDLILTDLSMPRLNGIEATRQLKKDNQTLSIPVLLLTAYEIRNLTSELPELFVEVLKKPCLPDKLLAVIQGVLSATKN